MDIEFHYYMTYLIAARAGFNPSDAYTMAYSSECVDDNDVRYEVNAGEEGHFKNHISQTMNILKPRRDLLRIYPLYHFVPGDPLAECAYRRDGKMHYLNTTPDSENAREIMAMAFRSRDIYRIGIACHAFVDTWAHQNFVGHYDYFNLMETSSKLRWIVPRIGHTGGGFNPDRSDRVWEDRRLTENQVRRDNKALFLDAAVRLFEELRRYVNPDCDQANLQAEGVMLREDLSSIMGEVRISRDSRIELYKKLALDAAYGGQELIDYEADRWMHAAVEERSRIFRIEFLRPLRRMINDVIYELRRSAKSTRNIFRWKDLSTYQQTDWFKFQQAVREHQREVTDLLNSKLMEKLEFKDW